MNWNGCPFHMIALRTALIALLVCLLRSPAMALDPSKAITQYGHDSWTSQDGLPGEATYEIVQTADGYLWLRTSNGLIRFDGVRFEPITPMIGGELLRETIRAICRSADGDLLIRSATRTLILKGGNFSDYLPPAPLPIGDTRVLYETRAHEVWIGGDNAFYKAQSKGVQTLQSATGWMFAFLQDHHGDVWIGGTYGLYRYHNGTLTNDSALYGIKDSVTALAEDRQGDLWVGTRNSLYRLHEGKRVPGGIPDGLTHQTISALLQDHNGNIWVGTDTAGLYRLAKGEWSAFTTQEGLTDNGILSLQEDREGSVWIGTKSGLERFRDTPLTAFTTREGLVHNDVTAIVEAGDGSLFIFSEGGGLTRLKDNKATVYTVKDGLASAYGNGLYANRDGSVWIGTSKGLSRFKDGKFTTYTDHGRLTKVAISAITEDEESLLVATSDCQVRRFRDGKFLPYTVGGIATPLSQPTGAEIYVFTTYRDPAGAVWFGVSTNKAGGLYRIAKGEKFATAEQPGIPPGIATVYDDQEGSLWLGGKVGGLLRLQRGNGRVTHYTGREGLFDDQISCILGDRQGNLWMSTARGIFMVSRKDLDDVMAGRGATLHPIRYGIADGMKTTEAGIPEHQPAGCRTRDGILWFTTHKGVVRVDPEHLPRNGQQPPVLLEQVVVDQKTQPVDRSLELRPGAKKWEFHYTALSLLVPERVQFRYKLEGYDHDWVAAGSRRVAYYTSLPPRSYRFRVTACNNDGVWNTEGASVAFNLEPHFYETPAFGGLCILGALLGGVGLHGLRMRQLSLQERALRRLVGERTKDLQNEIETRRRAETALRQAHDELEQRVQERTLALSQANAHLTVEITERRNAEEALRVSEEAERRFSERLMALHFVINELSRAASFDDLCRQAVELGRRRLDFDRLGIWFTTATPGEVRGSFGVGEAGEIRDERDVRFRVENTALGKILEHAIPLYADTEVDLKDQAGEEVGRGASATAALWDGERAIGFISTDNLLRHRPFTEHDHTLLTLYATTLGYLCSRKRMEEGLRESEARFRTLAANFPDSIARFDRDLRFLYVNPTVERYSIWKAADYIGKTSAELGLSEAFRNPWDELLRRVFETGQSLRQEFDFFTTNGERHVFEVHVVPERAGDGSIQSALSIGRDITERKLAEEALEHSRAGAEWFSQQLVRLQDVTNQLSMAPSFDDLCRQAVERGRSQLGFDRLGLWLVTADGKTIVGSFGTDEEGQLRDERNRRLLIEREDNVWGPFSDGRSVLHLKDARLSNDRSQEIGEGENVVAALWDGDRVTGFLSADNLLTQQPITEPQAEILRLFATSLGYLCSHKKAEEAIRQALVEKEVLLKEVHHRVKNNLQILSSLLKIQADFIRDPHDLTLFQESQNRIRSMAVVHEQLYQSGDLAHIDFGEYVRHLTVYLFRAYGDDAGRVRLEVDIETVLLGVDTAIPCGLIVNELVSNALKYAFPEGRAGTVRIRLHEEGEKCCRLAVADDGIGLPPDINIHHPTSVGLDLVSTLVQQLGGSIMVDRTGGTTFQIHFAAG